MYRGFIAALSREYRDRRRGTTGVRDHNGQQLAYVYLRGRSAAKLLRKDEAQRIAALKREPL
jgi:hypothetical protein